MIKNIHRSILLVSLIVLLAAAGLIMGAMYPYFQNVEANELKSQTKLAAQGVELNGKQYLKHFDNDQIRITWINKNGKVLYDNQADPAAIRLWTEPPLLQDSDRAAVLFCAAAE